MKRKILIITNTYFQLIVAVQLKLTEFFADDVDVIITDYSIKSKQVTERVRQTKLFRNVYSVDVYEKIIAESYFEKYKRYIKAKIFPKKTLNQYEMLATDYTDFLFNNSNFLPRLIQRCYRKQVKCYRFEEGFSTYTKPLQEGTRLRKLLIKMVYGDLEQSISGLYLFHPEYFKRNVAYPLLQIKILSKADTVLRDYLNVIFDYETPKELVNKKFIFLEESFRVSGIEMDDVELVEKIAAKVGKKNIIVKQHPRNRINVWENIGIDFVQTEIPWELILMNENFSEKILLTITSGSALASSLYLVDNVKSVFLYNYVDEKSPMLDENFRQYLFNAKNEACVILENTAMCQKVK